VHSVPPFRGRLNTTLATMTASNLNNKYKDEALRKIGRNVVNFQKMEAMLKKLIVHGNYNGPIKELKTILEEKTKSVDRKSMGVLAEQFVKNMYFEGSSSDYFPDDTNEPWISVSFKIEGDKKSISEQRRILSLIVSERNKLIHQMLMHFKPNSIESCQNLIRELDKQNDKIDPLYKYLQEIGKTLSEGRKKVAYNILNDESIFNTGCKKNGG